MRLDRPVRFALALQLCLLAGCASIRDVSDQKPYPKWLGTTDHLNCRCELWKDGGLSTTYIILAPLDKEHEYAILPEGTAVKIEAVQQELDSKEHPYDYAVVSLDDPKHDGHRLKAGVRFRFLQKMSKLEKSDQPN
jgi:hypothetical protein